MCPKLFLKTFQRELCQKLGQDIPTLSVIEQKKQTHFVSLIEDYYDGIKTHLLEEHRILKKMEKQNRSIYAQRGELHEERRMALIEQKEKTDGFKKIADEMSCICNFVPVDLPVDNISDQVRDPQTIRSGEHSVRSYKVLTRVQRDLPGGYSVTYQVLALVGVPVDCTKSFFAGWSVGNRSGPWNPISGNVY